MSKKEKKIDKRSKEYRDSIKEQDNITMGGTTETMIIEIQGTEDLKEEQLKMKIDDHVPDYLLKEMMTLVDCNCKIQAYDKFMTTNFMVTVSMQDAINSTYTHFYGEKLRRTSCSTCMKRRVRKVREKLTAFIDG